MSNYALPKFVKRVRLLHASFVRRTLDNLYEKESMAALSNIHSPLERHLRLNILAQYNEVYYEWTMKRNNKILEIYGLDFFPGKKILDLGGGFGYVGAFFAELGADVLTLEGRAQSVNTGRLLYGNIRGFRIERCDLEKDFSGFGKFDLIINMGLLYHLNNVKEHLECCAQCSDRVVLETQVLDSADEKDVVKIEEDPTQWAYSIAGSGVFLPPDGIEAIFRQNGFSIDRHFSRDLNVANSHIYDWEARNTGRIETSAGQLRRFWIFTRA